MYLEVLKYKPCEIECNSGGADGSDTYFENYCELYGIKINAFSYQTKMHKSKNKVEITEELFKEGIEKIKQANKVLCRKNIDQYINLLARTWAQVKFSTEIFAIGSIDDFKKGIVKGGTGWAVMLALMSKKTIYIFNQDDNFWYKWSYIIDQFIKINVPKIKCKNFAGIGTRKINNFGINAIENLFINTFGKLASNYL